MKIKKRNRLKGGGSRRSYVRSYMRRARRLARLPQFSDWCGDVRNERRGCNQW